MDAEEHYRVLASEHNRELASEHWTHLEAACLERWGGTWVCRRAEYWGSLMTVEAQPAAGLHRAVVAGELPGTVVRHAFADGAVEWGVGSTLHGVYGTGKTLDEACADLVRATRQAAADIVAQAERINEGRRDVR